MHPQQYWRAEVYTEVNDGSGQALSRKLIAGVYSSRISAEKAVQII